MKIKINKFEFYNKIMRRWVGGTTLIDLNSKDLFVYYLHFYLDQYYYGEACSLIGILILCIWIDIEHECSNMPTSHYINVFCCHSNPKKLPKT